jgi:hypothetical protein
MYVCMYVCMYVGVSRRVQNPTQLEEETIYKSIYIYYKHGACAMQILVGLNENRKLYVKGHRSNRVDTNL